MTITISGIFVYPVKSAAGYALGRAEIRARGFEHDRRWMVVDAAGRFLTQREHPRLALIRVQIQPGGLCLSAPGQPGLNVTGERAGPARAQRIMAEIWRDRVAATAADPAADRWLSEFLELDCRLVALPEDACRLIAPPFGRPGEQVSFADGFPYLLTSEDSLADLNARLARPVDMRRFRPNLVVRGCGAYAEDGWRRVQIGATVFRVVKPCSRCVVVTVDPDTGEKGAEPLRTLARYRVRDGKALFGMNLVAEGHGMIGVGDRVLALE